MFSKIRAGDKDGRLSRYDHLIVHCLATMPSMSHADAAWTDQVHKNRGWSGCGYHAVIPRGAMWQDSDSGYPTRTIGLAGAHVGGCGPGWNSRSFGVSMAGGINENGQPQDNFRKEQFATLEQGIRRFILLHPNPRVISIMGHRDLIEETNASPKACPSFDVADFLDERNIDINDIQAAPEEVGFLQRLTDMLRHDADDEDKDFTTASPMSLEASGITHKVEKGETLWSISRAYGISPQEIKRLNPNIHNSKIFAGDNLKVSR